MKNSVRLIFMILLSIGVMETLSFFAGKYIASKSSGGIFYFPSQSGTTWNNYSEKKTNYPDPVLGWQNYPDSIIRSQALHKANTSPSVSFYGDSFTRSSAVDEESKWPQRVAHRFNMNVYNFGVGGYGTDQSYLRYLYNPADSGEWVVLNHHAGNIVLNLMQHLNYDLSTFKPVFILAGDSLKYIPPVTLKTEPEFNSYIRNPVCFLPYDLLAPGHEYGPEPMKFPYTWHFLKTIFSAGFLKKINPATPDGELSYRQYYSNKRAVEITGRICYNFYMLAGERGKKSLITVIPAESDFDHFSATGKFGYEPLTDWLRHREIEVLDFGREIMKLYTPVTSYRELFEETHHLNAKGDSLLAEIFSEYLLDHGVKPAEQGSTIVISEQ